MGYIESSLLPGETLVSRARLHRVVFAKAVLVAVAGAVVLYFQHVAGAIVLLAALLMAIPPYVTSKTSEFGVTNKRVVIKVGVIRRRTIELLLRQVEAISVDQTVMGRLLARRALGAQVAELGFPVSPVVPVPFHALSGIGASATIQYLRFVDGLARVGGRLRAHVPFRV